MKPQRGDRNLSRGDVPAILAAGIVVAGFAMLALLGHPLYGAALLTAAVIVALRAMPRDQREAIASALEKRDQAPLGRLRTAIQIVVLLAILLLAVRAILNAH